MAATSRISDALSCDPICRYGRIVRSNGEILHASGIRAPIGSRCLIDTEGSEQRAAEVVGFDAGSLLIMPEQGTRGVVRGARVQVESRAPSPLVGDALLGRVIDARGMPLDGGPVPELIHPWPLFGLPINPMSRAPHHHALRCRRLRHQRARHHGPRDADRPLRRQRRRQDDAARHDGATCPGRHGGCRHDRRARPRDPRIRRGPSRRGARTQHGRGLGRRRYRAWPAARGLSCRRHRRILAQPKDIMFCS